MADFSENVVEQLKEANQKLDTVVGNTAKEIASGAAAAEDKKDVEAKEEKRTILFEQMADSLKALHASFLASLKDKGKQGLGIMFAAIAAPIVMLVAFFKQLALEFMFLKKITGKGLSKLFAPLKGLFRALKAAFGTDIDNIVKLIKNSKIGTALTSFKNFFTRIGTFFNPKNYKIFDTVSDLVKGLGAKVKTVITSLKTFFTPVGNFFQSMIGMGKSLADGSGVARKILGFAAKFGTILGKIFLPITILMSAFDFITGFMSGYDEGGILGGLEGGLTKLFQGLIGMPLDLLKSAVSWILGKFGFKNAEKALDSFSFSELISDIIGGIFSMIKGAVDWIKLLFTDPVAAMQKLWTGILVGYASLMDLLFSPVKSAIAWVMGLFGWDEAAAAAEKFSIKGFILGVFDTVKTWFTNLFSWGQKAGATGGPPGRDSGWSLSTFISGVWTKIKEWFVGLFSWAATEDNSESFVVKTVKGVITGVKTWLEKLFSFDSTEKTIASLFNVALFLPNIIKDGLLSVTAWLLRLFGFDTAAEGVANAKKWSLGSMIVGVFKKVRDWFLGIFGFGTDEKGKDKPINIKEAKDFSLATLLSDTIKKIWDWFKGLLDIDWKGLMNNLVPDWAKKILPGFGSDKPKESKDQKLSQKDLLEEAKKKGLYDEKGFAKSDINKDSLEQGVKSGAIQKEILQAIIADNDLAEKDMEFMKKLVNLATKKGSLVTDDKADITNNKVAEEKARYAELAKVTKQDLKDAVKFGISPELIARDRAMRAKIMDEMFADNEAYRKKLADEHKLALKLEMPISTELKASEQKAEEIQKRGIQRTGRAATAPSTVVNAPTTNVNSSSSNMTNTTTSFSHPSPILNEVTRAY